MPIEYNRLTIDNRNLIVEKAKSKKDGDYQIRGIHYRVVSGKVTIFACNGEYLMNCGAFTVFLGNYKYQYDGKPLKDFRS